MFKSESLRNMRGGFCLWNESWMVIVLRFQPVFEKVMSSAFEAYLRYLKELRAQRVHLQPQEPTNRTDIEIRIEMRFRTLLLNRVPAEVREQCVYQVGFTCAQVLYRTMTQADPADQSDRQFTQDLLVKPQSDRASEAASSLDKMELC